MTARSLYHLHSCLIFRLDIFISLILPSQYFIEISRTRSMLLHFLSGRAVPFLDGLAHFHCHSVCLVEAIDKVAVQKQWSFNWTSTQASLIRPPTMIRRNQWPLMLPLPSASSSRYITACPASTGLPHGYANWEKSVVLQRLCCKPGQSTSHVNELFETLYTKCLCGVEENMSNTLD